MLRFPENLSNTVIVDVDTAIYSHGVIFRVAYRYTGEYFVYLEPQGESVIRVHLTPKNGDLVSEPGAFLNALIEERVQQDIAQETRAIRELIVAEAFGGVSLLDRSGTDADYDDDPRGIAQ